MRYIAHVRQNPDESWAEPQLLKDHLIGTAELAAQFARIFNSEAWGYAAGIAHDTGKGTEKWQKYLMKKSGYGYDTEAHMENIPGKLPHAAPGAKLTEELFPVPVGRLLSYCIAGHHAGLPDWMGSSGSLASQLQKVNRDGISIEVLESLKEQKPGNPPWSFSDGLDMSLWIRMLFSCLTDADFLDTERYMEIEKSDQRGGYLSMQDLLNRFNSYMRELTSDLPDTEVNNVRQVVLNDCRAAAVLSPGFFSLNVPTGGGKTLSSMAFALEHAVKYRKERIIYVIPYTSIIEQNAGVFSNALGHDQVVEHHSNLNDEESTAKARLAVENWDAPVIVTTTVQFFESLFAAKTSRCRKLHNICNSIVILDEAHLLPVDYMVPILRTMELLTEHYGVSFVICTATQPVLEKQSAYIGFPGIEKGRIREIILDVPNLFLTLKRVQIIIPEDLKSPSSWEQISAELLENESILCIVSDRKSCRELFHLLPEGTYHLSALMCAQHRSDVIMKIKNDLSKGRLTRVVSTQLVEAGVDLDFPVVYRALSGLDSIAQAAGRCNREGKLNLSGRLGKVVVFNPPKKVPIGFLRKAVETTTGILRDGYDDLLEQSALTRYFSELYWKVNSLDSRNIISLLTPERENFGIAFRTAAKAFHLIDDSIQRTILVPYGDGAANIKLLEEKGPERWLLRRLQRYMVNIYVNEFNDFLKRGSIKEISPGIFSLICEIEYDNRTGLKTGQDLFDPEKYNI